MARLTGVALFLLQALDWHFQSTSSGQSSFKTRHRRQTPPTRPNNPPKRYISFNEAGQRPIFHPISLARGERFHSI